MQKLSVVEKLRHTFFFLIPHLYVNKVTFTVCPTYLLLLLCNNVKFIPQNKTTTMTIHVANNSVDYKTKTSVLISDIRMCFLTYNNK